MTIKNWLDDMPISALVLLEKQTDANARKYNSELSQVRREIKRRKKQGIEVIRSALKP